MASDQPIRRGDMSVRILTDESWRRPADAGACRTWYQPPILHNTAIASSARIEHHAMLDWPRGRTRNAASSGPSEEPTLPPTWNSDWASPWRPPDAIRATRDDSGWNTDDPTPTRPAATSSIEN